MSEARGREARGREARGRDALFSPPDGRVGDRAPTDARSPLWSGPPRRKGTVVVECGRCQARTPVPLVQLAPCLLASVWVPGRSFSRLLRCPACRRPAWCRVHWRTALD